MKWLNKIPLKRFKFKNFALFSTLLNVRDSIFYNLFWRHLSSWSWSWYSQYCFPEFLESWGFLFQWIKWFSKKIHWWQEAGYFMSNRCVVNNVQKRLNIAKWVSEKLFHRKFNIELFFVKKCRVVMFSCIKTKFDVNFFPQKHNFSK